MTTRSIVSQFLDKTIVERTSTMLLLGILWSSLAICILGALSYDIIYWFAGS